MGYEGATLSYLFEKRVRVLISEKSLPILDSRRWLIISISFEVRRDSWEAKLDYPDFKNYRELSSIDRGLIKKRDVFDAVCPIPRRRLPDPHLIGNVGSFFKNHVIPREQFSTLKMQY
jgi:UDP-N-acetylmuramate dehydrogenase